MGRGLSQRRRANNVIKARVERFGFGKLMAPPLKPDAPDRLPRSLRNMLAAKAAVEAATDRKKQRLEQQQQQQQNRSAPSTGPSASHARAPAPAAPQPGAGAQPPPPPAPQAQPPAKPKPSAAATALAAAESARRLKKRERSKARAARQASAKRRRARGGLSSDEEEELVRATGAAPAFGERVHAPLPAHLKRRHWAEDEEGGKKKGGSGAGGGGQNAQAPSKGDRLSKLFAKQLRDAAASASGRDPTATSTTAAHPLSSPEEREATRAAVVEAYRAKRAHAAAAAGHGGSGTGGLPAAVGGATMASLKALVRAGGGGGAR